MNTSIRICPQCSTPLAESEPICRNCGTGYIESAITQPLPFFAPPPPSEVFVADPASPGLVQQVAFPSFGDIASNTAAASSGQSDVSSPLVPPTETFAPVPRPRKGPNVGLILGIAFLIVLLIGGGLVFLIKTRGSTATAILGLSVPTATPGVGVPVVGGNWELTVKNAHQETQLTGGFGISETTYTPNSGLTFLVVDIKLRNLGSSQEVQTSTNMFAVIGTDGTISTPELVSFASMSSYAPGVASITSYGNALEVSLAFVVEQTKIGQVFKLQFQKVPLIPFSLK